MGIAIWTDDTDKTAGNWWLRRRHGVAGAATGAVADVGGITHFASSNGFRVSAATLWNGDDTNNSAPHPQTGAGLLHGGIAAETALGAVQTIAAATTLNYVLRGVDYGPFRGSQNPKEGTYPSLAEMEQDLPLLAAMGNTLRVFSVMHQFGTVITEAANLYGMNVIPSAYLNNESESWAPAVNQQEMAALVSLLNSGSLNLSKIPFVVVGSEAALNQGFSIPALVADINAVRAASPAGIKFTAAEPWSKYLDNGQTTALGNAVDVIFTNIYPFWENTTIDQAVAFIVQKYQALQAAYPDKPVVISETGWPSGGTPRGVAVPSLANQQAFWRAFLIAAKQNNIAYLGFEAFDESWKSSSNGDNEGDVGAHWGLNNEDRTAKGTITSFNPWVSGTAGDNALTGSGTNGSWLEGLGGNDILTGTASADVLFGDDGADTLRPGMGSDTASGGNGDDTISFTAGRFDATDVIDGGTGTDLLWLNGDYSGGNAVVMNATSLTNVENIAVAAGFNYNLTTADTTVGAGQQLSVDTTSMGASNALSFNGSAETNGTFVLLTGAGADTLIGGGGGDTFRAGGGHDHVSGNGGNDTISFSLGHLDATDVIDGGAGTDLVWLNSDYTGTNAVTFHATTMTNVETIAFSAAYSYSLTTVDATVGAGGTLTIDSSSLGASKTLYFNGSAETNGTFLFIGGAGAETVHGGSGNDTLSGRAGNDSLWPGLGNDIVSGGDGDDTICFTDGRLNTADMIDGGAGTDSVLLVGNYTGANAVIFNATTITNIETIAMSGVYSYSLKTVDATVAAGRTLIVHGSGLVLSNTLSFDGSAETDGSFEVTGGTSADTIYGGAGNDTLVGNAGNDTLRAGIGNDIVSGGDGDDTISFTGGRLNSADVVDGGEGWDTVWLNGDYAGANAVNFLASTMTNVDLIGLAAGFAYTLTSSDATVAAGRTLTIDASMLGASSTLTFDGSAETNGTFVFVSGSGGDSFTGGSGADTFKYDAASRSTGLHYDTINALNFANDSFDIPGGAGIVTAIDAAKTIGALSTASFDTDLATALSSLGAHHAILFTPNTGSLSGQTFMVVDCNGTAGYQSGQDLVIRLNGYSGTLTTGAFH